MLFACLFVAVVVSCTAPKKPAPESESVADTVATIAPADHHDSLSDKVEEIQKHLPLAIGGNAYQLKKVENDESAKVLTLYIFVDERVRGEWFDDGQKIGKYFVAQLVAMPEIMEEFSSEELEEQKDDKDFQLLRANMPNYEKVKALLKTVSDLGYAVQLNFHSRDDYSTKVDLTPEETKDAVVFYREILAKFEEDTGYDDSF